MVSRPTSLLRAIAALLLAFCAVCAAEVTASLAPASVPAGEGATLSLKIEGGQVQDLKMPQVPDVIIQGPVQNFSSSSNINGVVRQSLSLSYAVGSMKAGEYTIPPITVVMDGVEQKTQAFTLKVTPSANQQPQGFGQQGKGNPAATEDGKQGQLTVELITKGGRQQVWVGEIAPVRIRAWIPEGVRAKLAGNLQPESTAFTLHNLSDNPSQDVEIHNGRRWQVVTWFAGMSAAKAGRHLPDLSVKVVFTVPDPNALRSQRGFFGQAMIQKEVVLSSKQGNGTPIEVRALPKEGRPKNFSGAVGKFALESANLPAEWKTGEPQQISAVVKGEGNFTLLAQPDLLPDDNWKTYEGKSQFQPGDKAAFSGQQVWQFNGVAKKGGAQPLSLIFSYFDPESGRYETVSSASSQVQVSGADLPAEAAPVETVKAPPPPQAGDALPPQRGSDSGVRSLTAFAFRPAFRTTLIGCGAAALAGLVAAFLRTRQRDHKRAAQEAAEKAARAALHEAEAHAARGDVPGFFAAARRALQTRLAARWSRPAQAITLADVAARVPGDSPVTQIFREADRVEFGRAATTDLHTWRSLLRSAMNSLA